MTSVTHALQIRVPTSLTYALHIRVTREREALQFKGPPKSSRIAAHPYLFYNHTMDRNKSDFGMQGLISIINDIQEVFSIVGALFSNWITL